MAEPQWNEALQVGVTFMDDQHRNLLDAVAKLHQGVNAGKPRTEEAALLHYLQEYTISHFREEEAMMVARKYPGIVEHQAIHRELLSQLEGLVERHTRGSLRLREREVTFLENWLVDHFQGEDRILARFLRQS